MRAQSLAVPVASAVLGGGVTAAVLLGAGAVDHEAQRTIVQRATLVGGAGAAPGRLYRQAAPAVVAVRAHVVPRAGDDEADGSGFVIDRDGHVVTAAHLVTTATGVHVAFDGTGTVPA